MMHCKGQEPNPYFDFRNKMYREYIVPSSEEKSIKEFSAVDRSDPKTRDEVESLASALAEDILGKINRYLEGEGIKEAYKIPKMYSARVDLRREIYEYIQPKVFRAFGLEIPISNPL